MRALRSQCIPQLRQLSQVTTLATKRYLSWFDGTTLRNLKRDGLINLMWLVVGSDQMWVPAMDKLSAAHLATSVASGHMWAWGEHNPPGAVTAIE